MKHFSFGVVAVLAGLGTSTACDSPATSSSTNWAKCERVDDCADLATAVACQDGFCIDDDGNRLLRSSAATGGNGGASEVDETGGDGPGPGGSLGHVGGSAMNAGGTATTSGGSTSSSGGLAGAESGGSQSLGGGPTGGAGGVCDFVAEHDECSSVDDCTTAEYVRDCCGSRAVVGVNRANVEAFGEDAAVCAASYPACGCPAEAYPLAQDGRTIGSNSQAGVRCNAGRCESFVKARPCGGEACGADEVCVAYLSTTGPTQFEERVCLENTCGADLGCSCAQVFCDARTDRSRTCVSHATQPDSSEDILCEDSFQ